MKMDGPENTILPVTAIQRELCTFSEFHRDLATYNIPLLFHFEGELNVDVLRNAIQAIVDRHDSLRIRIEVGSDYVCQVVQEQVDVEIEIVRVADSECLDELLKAKVQEPIDIRSGILGSLTLFCQDSTHHSLCLPIHHVGFDGWSSLLVEKELIALLSQAQLRKVSCEYNVAVERYLALEALDICQAYAARIRSCSDGRDRAWPALISNDWHSAHSKLQSIRAAGRITGPQLSDFRDRITALGLTPFEFIAAAFRLFLTQTHGDDSADFSVVINARDAGFLDTVGHFTNTLPLVLGDLAQATVRELFETVRTALNEVKAHPYTPPALVRNAKQAQKTVLDAAAGIVLIQAAPLGEKKAIGSDLTLQRDLSETGLPKFDFALSIMDMRDEIKLVVETSNRHFTQDDTTRLAQRMLHVIQALMQANEDDCVIDLELMSSEERELANRVAKGDTLSFEGANTLAVMIRRAAERDPEAVAIEDVAGEKDVTYSQLISQMERVASGLNQNGIAQGAVVAINLARGPQFIVALCGVSLSGAAFLALNPSEPAAYRARLVESANASMIIGEASDDARFDTSAARIITLEELLDRELETPFIWGDCQSTDSLAYIVFTSGTTGTPKGAMISQQAITNRIAWMCRQFPDQYQRVLFKTAVNFDVYVAELFWPLAGGGTLVCARPRDGHRDPDHHVDLIANHNISAVHFVPSYLRVLLRHPEIVLCRDKLKLLMTSGETLDADLATEAKELLGCQIANLYGPAEAAVDVTCDPNVCPAPGTNPTIGRPIANVSVHILDISDRLAPVGTAGEIVISGSAVGMGYCNETEGLGFADLQIAGRSTAVYRTGDRGYYNSSGDLVFLGRQDRQVKVQGQRIEIDEVENILRKCTSVADAAVIFSQGSLHGFVRLKGDQCQLSELHDQLSREVPPRFRPRTLTCLDMLPANRSGKVDYSVLKELLDLGEPSARDQTQSAGNSEISAAAQSLKEIWAEVLGAPSIDNDTDFFEQGGDSLRAIILTYKAREAGLNLKVEDCYNSPRFGALAKLVERRGSELMELGANAEEPFSQLSSADRSLLPESAVNAFPMSRLQSALYVHAQSDPNYACYVSSYDVVGEFDEAAFRKATAIVAAKHPILRTIFDFASYSEPMQIILDHSTWLPNIIHLEELNESQFEAFIDHRLVALKSMKFDWGSAPLCYVEVHSRPDNHFQLTLAEPILDGWSVAVLVTDLLDCYEGLLEGDVEPIAPTDMLGMASLVAAERSAIADPRTTQYWSELLTDFPATILPKIPGTELSDKPIRKAVHVSPDANQAITAVVERLSVPPSLVLAAIHVEALSLLTGRSAVATCVMTNGRVEGPGTDKAVGLFLNPLPIIVDVGSQSWDDLITDLRDSQASAMEFRRLPFAVLRERFDQPITEAVFNYTHFWKYSERRDSAIEILSRKASDQTYFPLTVQASNDWRSGAFSLELEFGAGISGGGVQIDRVVALYTRVLADFCENHDTSIRTRPALSDDELRAALQPPTPESQTDANWIDLNSYLTQIAEASPEAIAVSDKTGDRTYSELEARTRLIAQNLQRGELQGKTIGVLGERSIGFVELCLGIMRAGAIYVPLGPDWPNDRVLKTIEIAEVALVTHPDARWEIGAQIEQATLSGLLAGGKQYQSKLPRLQPGDPAYVLFTSGTTGDPKGARLAHRGMMNHLLAKIEDFSIGPETVLAQNARQTFDISIWQMLCPLIVGGRVHVIDDDVALAPNALCKIVEEQNVTMLELVPSMLLVLLETIEFSQSKRDSLARLKLLIVTGEAFPSDYARRWFACLPNIPVANAYGPTECSDDVSHHILESVEQIGTEAHVPIGRELRNTALYVVDKALRLVPIGSPGELIVGGDGVGIDYINNPAETDRHFLSHLPGFESSGRVYRTGDLVCVDELGRYHFLGRTDDQIKLNGLRIEPGEIEERVASHVSIQSAYVTVASIGSTDLLVAYVVAAFGKPKLTIDELEEWTSNAVPWAIVPRVWQWLDAMPLNANGKLDRTKLPIPEPSRSDFDPPEEGIETLVADTLKDVLSISAVSRYDRLNTLGANSISGVRIAARLGQVLERRIDPEIVTSGSSVAAIARAIEKTNAKPQSKISASSALIQRRKQEDIGKIDGVAFGYFSREMLARLAKDKGQDRADELMLGDGSWRKVVKTHFGTIAHFILPIDSDAILAGGNELVEALERGIAFTQNVDARSVSLTGLLGAATNRGELVRDRVLPGGLDIRITDGLSVTIPTVALTVHHALASVGRNLRNETLGCLGCGNVGEGVLSLLLSGIAGPAPKEVVLCDPWLTTGSARQLERRLRHCSGYSGEFKLVGTAHDGSPEPDFYACKTILGATNAPNVLNISSVQSGSVIIDDSAPHCFEPEAMLDRIASSGDILATEGGIIRLPEPITERLNPDFPEGEYFRHFRPDNHSIMGCMFASVLEPSIVVVKEAKSRENTMSERLAKILELGCAPASISVEDTIIDFSTLDLGSFL